MQNDTKSEKWLMKVLLRPFSCPLSFCIQKTTVGFDLIEINGILVGCRMKCDERPCKNQGICIEDFQKGESRCACEHTSYYGDYCALGEYWKVET